MEIDTEEGARGVSLPKASWEVSDPVRLNIQLSQLPQVT